MSTSTSRPTRLNDEQLASMLALAEDADSVELKLTVPESSQRSTVAALELDPLDAQIRQVFFFDTPDLALNKVGVGGTCAARPGKGERLGREAAPGRTGRAPEEAPEVSRTSSSRSMRCRAGSSARRR